MAKNGDLFKLKESQTIALQLQREKIEEEQRSFNERISFLKREWSRLLTLIGTELEIPEEEASNWHISQKLDAFEYKAPDLNKGDKNGN